MKRKWVIAFSVAAFFHLLAAWFSIGHLAADEYFQILEFLSFKLGNTPVSVLPDEYSAQIRSWLQPGLYYVIARGLQGIGITNPFHWAFVFRLLAAALGWLSLYVLANYSKRWWKNDKSDAAENFMLWLCAFLWFLPALHARPSSEGMSGSVFLLGLGALLYGRAAWAGILFALAFEFRFQTAVMTFGALAWALTFHWHAGRERIRNLSALFGSGALVFAGARWIDFWGYGAWTFSPWNYVSYNLIQNQAAKFGVSPWWDVARMSFTEAWPLLGTMLLAGLIASWVRHPRHVLTWTMLPFFAVHCLIGHKELRFFYPVAAAAPFFLPLALSSRAGKFPTLDHRLGHRAIRAAVWVLAVWNVMGLFALSTLPAARNVAFYRDIWKHREEISAIHTIERDPYDLFGSPVIYYRPPELEVVKLKSFGEFNERLAANPGSKLWLFYPRMDLPPEAGELSERCVLEIRTLPSWVKRVNIGGWVERAHAFSLFRCG